MKRISLFDIIGPIIIGPSSSHTTGSIRIGKMAKALFGRIPQTARITLYNSFAATCKGHGTDKGIVAGLLGWAVDDTRLKKSFEFARKTGMKISWRMIGNRPDMHPNTARIEMSAGEKNRKNMQVTGISTGGGSIAVTEIDGFKVEITGQRPSLVVLQENKPGMVARISTILSHNNINIDSMQVFGQENSNKHISVIETDREIEDSVIREILNDKRIEWARAIGRIGK